MLQVHAAWVLTVNFGMTLLYELYRATVKRVPQGTTPCRASYNSSFCIVSATLLLYEVSGRYLQP